MKRNRETFLIAGIFLLLIVVTAVASVLQPRQEQAPPALSSSSNRPDGGLGLRLWLSSAGYRVNNDPGSRFAIPPGTQAVLILEPVFPFSLSSDDWKILDPWINQGGTLLLAALHPQFAFSGSPFKVSVPFPAPAAYDLIPQAPVFQSPALTQPVHLTAGYVFQLSGTDGSALLSMKAGPIAVQIQRGKGRVLLFAGSSFLTNQGLADPGNAEFAANLLAQIPSGSAVYIDEWHHGERSIQPASFGFWAWLTQTPAGFAVLFTAAVVFLGLVLAGRSFGRPLPAPGGQTRRGPLEFVSALANLERRAGHRQALMKYYHTSLKRTFGKRYRLDPPVPDSEFVDLLARFNPALDGPALLDLLNRLDRGTYTEIQIVQLGREAADWLEKNEH